MRWEVRDFRAVVLKIPVVQVVPIKILNEAQLGVPNLYFIYLMIPIAVL
jgi:hypothetical protein